MLGHCSNCIHCLVACRIVCGGGWADGWFKGCSKHTFSCQRGFSFTEKHCLPPTLFFWLVRVGLFFLFHWDGVATGRRKCHKTVIWYMLQNHLPHKPSLPMACAISRSFMLNKSSTQIQSAHLSHLQILPSVSSFIVVSLQPLIHLIKIGGLTPISLNHLSSWFCGPPICASNLSLVSLKCQRGGASMYLLAMDFSWNVPFSVHPTHVACFDSWWLWSIYFPVGCGNPTCWYTTIVRWVAVSPDTVTHRLAHANTNTHCQLDWIRLDQIRYAQIQHSGPQRQPLSRCLVDKGGIKASEVNHQKKTRVNHKTCLCYWRWMSIKADAGYSTCIVQKLTRTSFFIPVLCFGLFFSGC